MAQTEVVFIPTHHVVSGTLDNDDLCAANIEPQKCFDSYFQDQNEIVMFDTPQKYEIRVPIPTFTPPKSGSIHGIPVQTK